MVQRKSSQVKLILEGRHEYDLEIEIDIEIDILGLGTVAWSHFLG